MATQKIPFTNEYGQVINPGDKVIAVTEAWKQAKIRDAIYVGITEGKKVIISYSGKKYVYQQGYVKCMKTVRLEKNRIYKLA